MIPRQKPKNIAESIPQTNADKNTKRRKARVILVVVVVISLSVSTISGFGFAEIFIHGYGTAANSYKGSLCTTKVLDMLQIFAIFGLFHSVFSGLVHQYFSFTCCIYGFSNSLIKQQTNSIYGTHFWNSEVVFVSSFIII